MNEIDFNLLNEPWILVMKENGTSEEMNIIQVLSNAHEIRSISGETSTQDLAILRLLIAIISAIYLRIDHNGNISEIIDEDDAIERWKIL